MIVCYWHPSWKVNVIKLSTRSTYGLRAMFELASSFGKGHVSSKHISEHQGIPEQYLEQLFMTVRKAGLVASVRGAQGGYVLAKAPSEVTVGDIIRALDGPVTSVACLNGDAESACSMGDRCVTRLVWQKVQDSINHGLDAITLQDMLDDHKKMGEENNRCDA
jgi:Rrf2 family transcriptional regulator, cysteine metabolism repressor